MSELETAWRWVPVLPAVSESGTAWPSAPEPLWAPAVASVWECQQGAWIATGCAPVVGSGVAAGAAAAVGVAGAVVATAGEVCSPPQAVRAMTADRHSSNSTAAAFTVPVILPLMNFMAPFSAPGKVGSMPWTVYPPGVRVDSGGCLGRAVTPEFLFLRGGSAARVGPASASTGPTGPRARHSWRAASVESPGLRPAVRRPVLRTAVSASGPALHKRGLL